MADVYMVRLYEAAYDDLNDIYRYITRTLKEPHAAESLIASLEQAILSLQRFPKRHPLLPYKVLRGSYRILRVKNYSVIYKINEREHIVYVVSVLYSPRIF